MYRRERKKYITNELFGSRPSVGGSSGTRGLSGDHSYPVRASNYVYRLIWL